jgi:HK97 family phage major capsid protein
MRATDQMLARLSGEIAEKQNFIDGVVEAAENEGRDLTSQEMELVTRARTRQGELNDQAKPMQEAAEIAHESARRISEIGRLMGDQKKPVGEIAYRTAGEWTVDYIAAVTGSISAKERIEQYTRAAAHQTTADNPGLLPVQIVGDLINFVDQSRPLIGFFGARQMPSGSWSRPRITQHTNIAAQSAEKTELVSRKMLIDSVPVVATTLGGYVNLSRQNQAWSQPAIMDIVVSDLAGQYAIETENAFADALMAAATAETALPTGAATAAQVSAALWTAVGNVYTATKGVGRLFQAVSPDMLGILGPLFAPVNPQNSQSTGFNAADIGSGTVGSISGVPVIVSAGLNAGSWLVGSTAGAEVYEDRIGVLSVIEPSVLGTQVAYGGFFADVVLVPTALRKIAKTP